jgi:STE24 endopeptidase
VAVLAAAALATAGAVALAARAPASLRAAEPGRAALDPARGARFSDEQVRRGAAYSRPRYLAFALGVTLEIVLVVVLARGPWTGLVDRIERLPGGWALHAAVAGVAVAVIASLVTLPLAYVRGYAIEHAWGLSTQDVMGWLSDRGRALAVGAATSAITAVAFFGVVRWQPRTWWVWGWIAFTGLSAALVFLWPVVVAPLFNRFTPLEEGLAARVRALARAAEVEVEEVLVADASRRSTVENAYVAGLGSTRRIVLYDTLLRDGREQEALYVAAHELGHEAERHVLKGLLLSAAGLLVGFAALAWLSSRPGLWSWAGARGVGDLRALPALMLFGAVMGLVVLPVQNTVSRSFEKRADEIAVALTGDPETATRVLRRLALNNLADLRPPAPVVLALYSHPPIPQRIEALPRSAAGP